MYSGSKSHQVREAVRCDESTYFQSIYSFQAFS